jgi:hypothetical protein
MAAFDDLPADQKAVLQLVLRQGRTYEDIAGLLKISVDAVRERALTALDALGPEDAAGLTAAEQDDAGDYLLGQQSASARGATREALEVSAPARTWARAVAAELRGAGIAGEDALPEIPADEAETEEAFEALEARQRARVEQERSSRVGARLLLAAGAIVAAVLILWLAGAFDGGGDGDAPVAVATTTAPGTGTAAAVRTEPDGALREQQISLTPPPSGRHPGARGTVKVARQGDQRLVSVVATGLPTSNHYALWLREGSRATRLGFFRAQAAGGADRGRLVGQVRAPADFSGYGEVLISHEPSAAPEAPTRIELQGPIAKG